MISKRRLLVELGELTGQAEALDSIDYLVNSPTAMGKIPTLVLVGASDRLTEDNVVAADLRGAVLMYEYQVAGFASRVFATDDVTGHKTLIAPAVDRLLVAEAACQELIQRGGLVALISFEEDVSRNLAGSGGSKVSCRVAKRTRTVPRDMMLADTLKGTMARLGSNTRRNFRRYRVRSERDLGAYFIDSAEIGQDDFLKMNRNSTNPVNDAEAAWRYSCMKGLPGVLCAGVKAGDGRWLSLIGGRRHNGTTKIEWQMNLAGLPRYSLSTVMRAYLLEHEIALGTTKLSFRGGTQHAMGSTFLPSRTADVLFVRSSIRAWMLQRMARWIFPKSNFLRSMLLESNLVWTKYSLRDKV